MERNMDDCCFKAKDVDFEPAHGEDWYDVVDDLDDDVPISVQKAAQERCRTVLLTTERDRFAAQHEAAEQALAEARQKWTAAEEELQGRVTQLAAERDDCDARLRSCQQTLAEAQRQLKRMAEDWEGRCNALEAERDECAGRQRTAERALADLKRKWRTTEEEWETQVASLTGERDQYEAKHRSAKRSLADAQRQWKATEEELEGRITDLEAERDDCRAKHRAAERSLAEVQRKWRQTEEELHAHLEASNARPATEGSTAEPQLRLRSLEHGALGASTDPPSLADSHSEDAVLRRLAAVTQERDELRAAQQTAAALVADLEGRLAAAEQRLQQQNPEARAGATHPVGAAEAHTCPRAMESAEGGESPMAVMAKEREELLAGHCSAEQALEAAGRRWAAREKELEGRIAALTRERDQYAAGEQAARRALAEAQRKWRTAEEVRRYTVVERGARSGSSQGESTYTADLADPIAASVVVISCAPCVERDLTATGEALHATLAAGIPATFLTAFLKTVYRVPALSLRQLLAGLTTQPRPPRFAASSWVDLNDPFHVVRHNSGRTKCLIVAMHYRGHKVELQDSVPEARNVKRWLFFQGFSADPDCLQVLADDGKYGRTLPTKANILEGLRWLAADARPGDNLLFLYAGHGAHLRRPSSHGGERVVTGLLPLDFEEAGPISDQMLFQSLILRLPHGAHLTVLMDCFHAAPAIELPYCFHADADNSSLVLNPNFSPDSFVG